MFYLFMVFLTRGLELKIFSLYCFLSDYTPSLTKHLWNVFIRPSAVLKRFSHTFYFYNGTNAQYCPPHISVYAQVQFWNVFIFAIFQREWKKIYDLAFLGNNSACLLVLVTRFILQGGKRPILNWVFNTVSASSQCYWDELMLWRSQINTKKVEKLI